jgi:biotin carboxyl carrier protein
MGFDVNKNHVKLKQISSPMPGLVLKVLAAEGDEVTEGQPVLVLEAMKMENVLSAPTAGVISEILTQAGKNVNKGQVLVKFD